MNQNIMEATVTGKSKTLTISNNDYLQRIQYATLSFSGGLLGTYSILMCDNVFANAQTSNIINFAFDLKSGNFIDALFRIFTFFLYILGIALSVILPQRLDNKRIHWKSICLLIETVCISIVGFMPMTIPSILYISPIFFAAALQYNTFNSCNNINVSTLFCTNNFRQLIISILNYKSTKENFALTRIIVYSTALISFFIGAFCCFLIINKMQQYTVFISAFIMLINYIMFKEMNESI